jgi:hypothetical protein
MWSPSEAAAEQPDAADGAGASDEAPPLIRVFCGPSEGAIATPSGISIANWDRVHELALEVFNASAEGEVSCRPPSCEARLRTTVLRTVRQLSAKLKGQ